MLAFTPNQRTRAQLALIWGVETYLVPTSSTPTSSPCRSTSLIPAGRVVEGDRSSSSPARPRHPRLHQRPARPPHRGRREPGRARRTARRGRLTAAVTTGRGQSAVAGMLAPHPAGVVEWQTRSTQNALAARSCGFKSRSRHQTARDDVVTDPSRADRHAGHHQAAQTRGPSTRRILVAEDEALIRLDLVEMLGEQGYEVVGQASNGEQAVELAKELRPDIVIMDVKMPVLDGLSAAEQIGTRAVCPVIMLTAFSQTELVERARDAGVMAYIVKPFTADDLAPAIDIAPLALARAEGPRGRGRRPRRAARDPQARRPGQGRAHDPAEDQRGRRLPVDPEDRHGPPDGHA